MKATRWLLILVAAPLLSACSTIKYFERLDSYVEENDYVFKYKTATRGLLAGKDTKGEGEKKKFIITVHARNPITHDFMTEDFRVDEDVFNDYEIGDKYPIFFVKVESKLGDQRVYKIDPRRPFSCYWLCVSIWRDISFPGKIIKHLIDNS